jgi:hypothetical protein
MSRVQKVVIKVDSVRLGVSIPSACPPTTGPKEQVRKDTTLGSVQGYGGLLIWKSWGSSSACRAKEQLHRSLLDEYGRIRWALH